jgi:hypothetical protein
MLCEFLTPLRGKNRVQRTREAKRWRFAFRGTRSVPLCLLPSALNAEVWKVRRGRLTYFEEAGRFAYLEESKAGRFAYLGRVCYSLFNGLQRIANTASLFSSEVLGTWSICSLLSSVVSDCSEAC